MQALKISDGTYLGLMFMVVVGQINASMVGGHVLTVMGHNLDKILIEVLDVEVSIATELGLVGVDLCGTQVVSAVKRKSQEPNAALVLFVSSRFE